MKSFMLWTNKGKTVEVEVVGEPYIFTSWLNVSKELVEVFCPFDQTFKTVQTRDLKEKD